MHKEQNTRTNQEGKHKGMNCNDNTILMKMHTEELTEYGEN